MQKAPFVAVRGRGQHWIELVSLKKHWTKQKQKTNSRNKVLVNPKVQNQIKTGFKLELCSPHNNTYRTLFLKTTFYVLFSRNRIIPLTRILFHLSTKTKSVSTTLILLSYQIQLPVFSFDHSLFAAMLHICQVVFQPAKYRKICNNIMRCNSWRSSAKWNILLKNKLDRCGKILSLIVLILEDINSINKFISPTFLKTDTLW